MMGNVIEAIKLPGKIYTYYRRKNEKFRLFHNAVIDGDTNKMDELIRKGLPPSCQDEKGRTALHIAADLGLVEMLVCLIRREAQANLVDRDQNTPLHFAVLSWNEYKLPENEDDDDDEEAVQHYNTVIEKKEEIVGHLLTAGAQCNSKNRVGRTALHYAAAWNLSKIVSTLKENGVQMNIVDKEGKSALWWAKQKQHWDLIPKLVHGGAWLYEQDKENKDKITLYLPATNHLGEMTVKLLLKESELRRMQNQLGDFAPDGLENNWDRQAWNIRIASTLLKRMAKPCEREDVSRILRQAFRDRNVILLQLLLDCGALLNIIPFEKEICGVINEISKKQDSPPDYVDQLVDIFYKVGIMDPETARFIVHRNFDPHSLKTSCKLALLRNVQPGRTYDDVKEYINRNVPSEYIPTPEDHAHRHHHHNKPNNGSDMKSHIERKLREVLGEIHMENVLKEVMGEGAGVATNIRHQYMY